MNKEQKKIKEQYDDMCCSIADAPIYDGRNTIDEYVCQKCGKKIYTEYKVKGVTPFVMSCTEQGCTGLMSHTRTFPFTEEVETKKFYRPSFEEFVKMGRGEQQHILNGGLVLER